MNRLWTKCALGMLVIATICDAMAHGRRRANADRTSHKEAIMEWEHEGGALPNGPAIRTATS